MKTKEIKSRLEYLRGELRQECISYGELAELQSLAEYIELDDTELLEAAGVPEYPEKNWQCDITRQICYCSNDRMSYPESVEIRFDAEDYDRIARVSILVKENNLHSARIDAGGYHLLDDDGNESDFNDDQAQFIIYGDSFVFYCQDSDCCQIESESISFEEIIAGFKEIVPGVIN